MIQFRDPRILQLLILLGFTVLGRTYLHFQVTTMQIFVTLATAILLEWAFMYWRKGIIVIPYSAVISALGIALMLRADSIAPYIMAAIIAISSKFLIRYQGNHIFNPSNIGIVAIAIFFPITVATAPLQWGFYVGFLLIIILMGTYLVYKVRRLPLVTSFLIGFVLAGLIRILLLDQSINTVFNNFMWGGLLVFTFHMITDPKTSPVTIRSQIHFGFGVALIGQLLIYMQIPAGLLISLALVTMSSFLWQYGKKKL